MSIPSQKEIQIPLLHLIYSRGGQVNPGDACAILADYFRLTEKERAELLPSGLDKKFNNRVHWARNSLCYQGLLDRTIRGLWKITEKGRQELSRVGLIDKPFPISASSQVQTVPASTLKSDDDEIIHLILEEIAPDGAKKFPDDFLDDECTDFCELELPGMQLQLAPLSQTTITSPKGYFRYQAKNPPEAKYILYAHNVGSKKVRIPRDNLVLFKAVKAYEKYCDEMTRRAFELFLKITHNEDKSEELTKEIARRLNLRVKSLIVPHGHE